MQKGNHIICFGEVLMDNLPEGRRLGGAPLNVCYHLNKNGLFATMVSQVGNDELGSELLKGIAAHGIDTTFIPVTKALATSSVEVTVDSSGRVSYEILEPVAWDALSYDNRAAELITSAAAFVYGSLVARSHLSRSTLFRYLDRSHWPVFDVNLRPPFFDRELILVLISKCRTLKVNDEELRIIVKWLSGGELPDKDAMDCLLGHFLNVEEILLTRGSKGAIYKNRTYEVSKPAKAVDVKDTVGSGDAFLAGFLARRIQGANAEDALIHAINLSAYVAGEYGACPNYPPPNSKSEY